MKTSKVCGVALLVALGLAVGAAGAPAKGWRLWEHEWAPADSAAAGASEVRFEQRDLSGPRMGVMFAGNGSSARRLRSHDLGTMVSEFGWHFERRVVPMGGGPEFVTQAVPLFGGVEYGTVLPSLTLAMGMRFRSGFEFGMGPSFSVVNDAGETETGLVIAVGKSLEYSGVSVPINLAISTNPKGTTITLLTGYAVNRVRR